MEALAAERLGFTYAGERTPALREISFSLEAGELCVLCGATGSGKSTLLRLLKRELAPRGACTGSIRLGGRLQAEWGDREAAAAVGFVAQRPEQQIVTDRVWHEMAFGLENLGCPEGEMHRRVAETAAFFGLEPWFDARTDDLSGGQKQLLNLAAVTALRPEVLLLDEPVSRLDPIAAEDFLSALVRLNRETGMTVLLSEHHPESILARAHRLLVMRAGRLVLNGSPREVCRALRGEPEERYLPAPVRVWQAAGAPEDGAGAPAFCPLSVAEGRAWLAGQVAEAGAVPLRAPFSDEAGKPSARERAEKEVPALLFREVSFRFTRGGPDVLRSASFAVRRGESFCLLGGNGSGKTTALRAAAGLLAPYSGDIRLFGKKLKEYRGGDLYHHGVAMLPQDVQTLFLRNTVREELKDAGADAPADPAGASGELRALRTYLAALGDRHPYDLSGGEQQLLALCRVLGTRPRLLLLDEPTGGLDALWRERLIRVLRGLQAEGMTLLTVTHDTAFAAEVADRCALLFRGGVLAGEAPRAFFAGGSFYTTPVRRMTRGLLEDCVTVADAAEALARLREARREGRRG